MSWMDKVRNLLDTSTSEKGCHVLSTEASYLISAPRIYHAERHGKVSLSYVSYKNAFFLSTIMFK